MINKEREVPLIIVVLETLLRRLPELHPKRKLILDDYAKWVAGYKGEVSLDYHLNLLDQRKYFILHDLRLMHQANNFFQIDTLLLTLKYILILEIKNISGTVFFDSSFNQFTRTLNGKEERFTNPLSQIHKHEKRLKIWLHDNSIVPPPIKSLVVFSSPHTIIKADSKFKDYQKVVHSENLLAKIDQFEKNHTSNIFTEKDLKKISRLLLKKNSIAEIDILKKYGINPDELIRGVHCPKCMHMPLQRKGTWYCPQCNDSFKDAHKEALKDYFHLIGPTINHQQFKEFLQIESRFIATKLLASLNLPYSGSNKNRVYHLVNI
ncbi:nuclease-related domain-containing protein [Sutcliffiella halmapala]|uniref:nuclease-related domain-containing protein n=1 Tax=Sutcliffiella halmapala TaxID=79882 RepID=UPI0014739112|nr:nuclease-related domain-containing protein [Sutcliffiella halmapala]